MDNHTDRFSLADSNSQDSAKALSREAAAEPAKDHGRAAAAVEDYKIGDKIVKLPAGFQRKEAPEQRREFPTPDLGKELLPKGSPETASKERAGSNVGGYVSGALGQAIKLNAQLIDKWTKDKPWEEFGKDRSFWGIGKDLARLVSRRYKLENENLKSSYPPGGRSGHLPADLLCPATAEVSRSPNGTCNDLKDPGMGAAGTRFQYNTKADTRYDINDPPLMDAARILDRKEFKELPVLNLMGVASIQANVHDWMDHGKHQTGDGYWSIPLPEDHPIRKNHGQKEMKIPKLLVDSTRNTQDAEAKVRQTYQNTVTHWWDASEIYGSDADTASRLRSQQNGKMKLTEDGLLPMGAQGVPDTGFSQNWNPLLEVVHTLYVREHNSICEMLNKAYPQSEFAQWKDRMPEVLKSLFGEKLPESLSDAQYDEFIYSRARLINAAEKAKIHTIDWTPVALNNKTMTNAMIGNYGQEKTAPLSRINQHELGGIWGHKTELAGQPYAMEEDFVQSYQQMHGLVPDQLKLIDHKTGKQLGEIPMGAALQGNSRKVIEAAGFDNVLYSMEIGKAGQITDGNHPEFMRDLNIRGNHIDLAAVDILRGREKQLPRYNEYLRQMHEKPVASFEELIPNNVDLREQIRKVYNNDIEKVDTVIGSLAEWPDRTPKTMGFSASTFLEFILKASRHVQADRFFTEDFRPEIYTPEGIARIRSLDGMKEIITRNAPELKDAVATRQTAFHPLGEGPIPLNNSGFDMEPSNDIQSQLAAFDKNKDGEVSLKEFVNGYKAIGNNSLAAYYKAAMTRKLFGNQVGDVKSDWVGLYKPDGNLDSLKVDLLFRGKISIKNSDLDVYLKSQNMSSLERHLSRAQFAGGFQMLGKESINRDEFVKIMNGQLMKERLAATPLAGSGA